MYCRLRTFTILSRSRFIIFTIQNISYSEKKKLKSYFGKVSPVGMQLCLKFNLRACFSTSQQETYVCERSRRQGSCTHQLPLVCGTSCSPYVVNGFRNELIQTLKCLVRSGREFPVHTQSNFR